MDKKNKTVESQKKPDSHDTDLQTLKAIIQQIVNKPPSYEAYDALREQLNSIIEKMRKPDNKK